MEECTDKRKTQTQRRHIQKGGIRGGEILTEDAPFDNEIAAQQRMQTQDQPDVRIG